MKDAVLVFNAGSSSIKFALYPAAGEAPNPLIRGKIEGIGRAPDFWAKDARGKLLAEDGLAIIGKAASHGELTLRLLDWLDDKDDGYRVAAAGHRVVHGGREFSGPAQITPEVVRKLENLTPLAPLHQPHNLAAIKALAERYPDTPQVACFDTSFHTTRPHLAQMFALPRQLTDEGIVSYGFHGLSYDYIASALPSHLGAAAEGRVIVAHLGNGASMCALLNRKSVATTMAFTALHGLMMGRRCGTLDAGVVLHLLQNRGLSIEDVHKMLYRESGLLGVSGNSNNMQVLEASDAPEAVEAIDLYCYRAAQEIGALTASLGGLDAIVFTAGIGENSSRIRRQICERLAWMGVTLDEESNLGNASRISGHASAIDVLVIPTNEEAVIAEAAQGMVPAP